VEHFVNTKPNYPVEMVDGLGLNLEQRLYVIDNGAGFSCFGFDNCFEEAQHLSDLMELPALDPELRGTRECYRLNEKLLRLFAKHPASKRTWFRPGTPKAVQRVLEAARASCDDFGTNGTMLRIFYGDPQTGRDWCEEHSTVGFIARTGGVLRVPLLLEPLLDGERNLCRSDFGDAVNMANIVRIIDVRRAEEVYRAKNYVLPQFAIEVKEGNAAYPVVVTREDQSVAAFDSHEKAAQWIAFMQGFRVHQAFRTQKEHRAELDTVLD
jgi:hypothetical protein